MNKKVYYQKKSHSRNAIIVLGIINLIFTTSFFFPLFIILDFGLLYTSLYTYLLILVQIIIVNVLIKEIRLSFYRGIEINIFISHSVENFEEYKIKEISEYLEKKKFIKKVIFCESDAYDAGIRGDIENWVENSIPLCQILLFITTESSISSKNCAHELGLALENNMEFISVVDDRLSLNKLVQMNNINFTFRNRQIDLSGLDLDRKSRIIFSGDFTELTEALDNTIILFKEKIDDILKGLKKKPICDISLLEKQLQITTTEIEKTIRILLKIDKIKGAWTLDKRYFLNEKEVRNRLKRTKKLRKFEKNNNLIEAAGFHNESAEDVKNILEKKKGWIKKVHLFAEYYVGDEDIYNMIYRFFNRRIKIKIFISHPLENFDNFELKNFSKYIKANKAIKKVFYNKFNQDSKRNYEDNVEWSEKKIPLCQTLLFIATKSSIISRQRAYELHIAKENDMQIIPVIDSNIEWEKLDQMNDMNFTFRNRNIDLSGLDLSRKMGVNFRSDYVILTEDLIREVGKFVISLEKVLQKLYEYSNSNIYILERQLNINAAEIEKIIKILVKIKKIKGVWTEDKKNFLTKKEVKHRLGDFKKKNKIKNDNQLIKAAGIHDESFEVVKQFYGDKFVRIKKNLIYIPLVIILYIMFLSTGDLSPENLANYPVPPNYNMNFYIFYPIFIFNFVIFILLVIIINKITTLYSRIILFCSLGVLWLIWLFFALTPILSSDLFMLPQ